MSSSKARSDLRDVRVLVVEDDIDTLELHALALRDAGARVEAVTDADAGLAALDREEFDVVISDLRLPGIDGFDFMRRVRARGGRLAKLPAVAVTGLSEDDHVDAAAQAGYHAHVKKPLAPNDLVTALAFWGPSSPRR
jgi:CheY-like chemotaxis protein